jgi:hypothetical protein
MFLRTSEADVVPERVAAPVIDDVAVSDDDAELLPVGVDEAVSLELTLPD